MSITAFATRCAREEFIICSSTANRFSNLTYLPPSATPSSRILFSKDISRKGHRPVWKEPVPGAHHCQKHRPADGVSGHRAETALSGRRCYEHDQGRAVNDEHLFRSRLDIFILKNNKK